jgi:hypothetical protein
MHVHAQSAEGEAKYWIEPEIRVAVSYGLKGKDLSAAEELIKEHESEIRTAWHEHFER